VVYGTPAIVNPVLLEWAQQQPGVTLCIHRNGQTTKPRRFIVINGVGLDHKLGVYNNDINAVARALIERSVLCEYETGFSVPLRPEPGFYYDPVMQTFARSIRAKVRGRRRSLRAVVEMYYGAKKQLYANACADMEARSLLPADATLKAFAKFEKQDITKAPRIINPRSVHYNLLLASFLKRIEKRIYKAMNAIFGGRTRATVIKGFNARQSAEILHQKWSQFKKPVAVGLDAKKFDLHVSIAALLYEHGIYLSLFPGEADVALLTLLLKAQLKNRGVAHTADGKIKFSMLGTRCSGDINTSLGNCILMCSLLFTLAVRLGIKIELANNGDDCMVFMEESDLAVFMPAVDAFFASAGFKMTVEEPVRVFERVEFCQTRPVELNDGWVMVRNHDTVLRKDPMCMLPITNHKGLQKWMGAVGECGLSLTQGVPVQSSLYRAFVRCGLKPSAGLVRTLVRNTAYNERKFHALPTEITALARVSYCEAFGITPDWQIALEKFYDSMVLEQLDTGAVGRDMLVIQPGISLNAETITKTENEGGQNGPPAAQSANPENARNYGQPHPPTRIVGGGVSRHHCRDASNRSEHRPLFRSFLEQVAWSWGLSSVLKQSRYQSEHRRADDAQHRPVDHYSTPGISYTSQWTIFIRGPNRIAFESRL
jgi:hypothetical protein